MLKKKKKKESIHLFLRLNLNGIHLYLLKSNCPNQHTGVVDKLCHRNFKMSL